MENRNEEKLSGGEIAFGGSWRSKLENFWFYHKWHLLITVFVIFVILVCVLQSMENKKDDVTLLLAGPYKMTATEVAALRTGLNDVLPTDFTGDGEKYAEMVLMQIFSDSQEAEIKATPEGEMPPYRGYIDPYYNDEQVTSFDNLIMAGEYSICVLDPWLFERVKGAGGLRKLSEVLGNVPESAVDEYGILLADTAFAKAYPVCEIFPEGTVICLRGKSVLNSIVNKKKNDREYTESEEMFRAIVQFGGGATAESVAE